MRDLTVRRESIESRDAMLLLAEMNAELSHRHPEAGLELLRLSADDVAPGRGAFVIARADRQPVGCGAVRRIDLGDGIATAEIKRMFVLHKCRAQGVGLAILQKLEALAGSLGVNRLVLAVGERQPEALALFNGNRYARMVAFGDYANLSRTVCMAKDMRAAPHK